MFHKIFCLWFLVCVLKSVSSRPLRRVDEPGLLVPLVREAEPPDPRKQLILPRLDVEPVGAQWPRVCTRRLL